MTTKKATFSKLLNEAKSWEQISSGERYENLNNFLYSNSAKFLSLLEAAEKLEDFLKNNSPVEAKELTQFQEALRPFRAGV